jgi:hypothetical protein
VAIGAPLPQTWKEGSMDKELTDNEAGCLIIVMMVVLVIRVIWWVAVRLVIIALLLAILSLLWR